eukprot:8401393-Pyramimonas_sp.AAC.1
MRGFSLRSGLVPEAVATTLAIEDTLKKIIQQALSWITLKPRKTATVSPFVCNRFALAAQSCFQGWQPFNGKSLCACGQTNVLWRSYDAVFFTFSMGMRRGR